MNDSITNIVEQSNIVQQNAITSGWTVTEHYFPMRPNTNIPAINAWNKVGKGVYPPTDTYGIALQADDLCLDCDKRNYPPGKDMAAEWMAKYPGRTRAVKTPSGGWHLRYKKNPDIRIRKEQPAWPGIEFRSLNHCIVGPGCHRDQMRESDNTRVVGDYVLHDDGSPTFLPDELLTDLEQASSDVKNSPKVDEQLNDWSSDYQEQFKAVCEITPGIPRGNRGLSAFKIAAKGRDLNLPLDETFIIVRDYWNNRNEPPLSDKELYQQVEHAYKYAKNTPGIATAEKAFKPELIVLEQSDNVESPEEFQHEQIKKTLFQKQLTPKLDKAGEVIGYENTQGNIVYILRSTKYWHGRLFYNQFSDKIEIKGRPDWRRDQLNKQENITELDYAYIRGWLSSCQEFQLEVSISRIAEACTMAAQPYHPVKDYLNSLVWDNVARLDTILPDTTGCKDTPYTRAAGKCMMISAVKRIFEPGCKQDYLLVLESEQGTKKSTWVETLGGDWYSTGELIPNDKDTYQVLRGKWFVELPEIDNTFSKAEFAWLKKTITTSVDTYRPSYARSSESVPRESIFIATLNPGASGEYLRDFQNRRYWPISTGGFNIAHLQQNRDQYFAEAKVRYDNKEATWIDDPKVAKLAKQEQELRRETDYWTEVLKPWANIQAFGFTTEEAFLKLGFEKPKEIASHIRKRLYQTLKDLGYECVYLEFGIRQWQKIDIWKNVL